MKRNPQAAMQEMRKNMDPNFLKQMGGADNLMNMAKSMGSAGGVPGAGGGMPDMGAAMKMVQGMMGGAGRGGGGGMPDMGAMMQ